MRRRRIGVWRRFLRRVTIHSSRGAAMTLLIGTRRVATGSQKMFRIARDGSRVRSGHGILPGGRRFSRLARREALAQRPRG
jgi:hypothetical protein